MIACRRAVALAVAILVGGAGCGARGKNGDEARIPASDGTAAGTASASAAAVPDRNAAARLPSTLPRTLPAGQDEPPRVAHGTQGAVASQEAHATDVGIDVLKRGGNAVDAAVAVAFALAVTHPAAGNVGGGGFMVVRLADGTTAAIDYRERAPEKAHRDMYLDARGNLTKDSTVGARAAGIPGTVAGLALAHQRFGKLAWAELVHPAVRLAREGHRLDEVTAEDLREASAKLRADGLAASAAYYVHFLPPAPVPGEDLAEARSSAGKRLDPYFAPGDVWKQPELAATLEAIEKGGPDAFYRGPIAERLVAGVAAGGGIWSLDDLAGYRAVSREPIRFSYRGHEVVTMPPPSAGGVVMQQILTASELLGLERHPWQSAAELHGYVEAARRAYADRNSLLGDPDFVNVPVAAMVARDYVAARIANIQADKATPSEEIRAGLPAPHESTETTHFSVVDGAGNAVANTYTLNTSFGSGYVVPGTGVLLNNEMDDFAAKPGTANVYGLVQSEQNAIAPKKRMLSSMAPTILVKDGDVRAVLGTPGGPTITTTVVQLVRALVDYGQRLDAAVAAPRVHHQWLPDAVILEKSLPDEAAQGLERRGHKLLRRDRIGHANSIEIDPATRGFRAVADTGREGGKAAAY